MVCGTANKALVIHHLRSDPDDAATGALAAAGFELDHRHPIEGDPLPDLGDGHTIALMHGSLADVTKHHEPGIAEEMRWIEAWWASGRPFFGICHGLQLACQLLGARVGPPEHGKAEFGYYPLRSFDEDLVPDGLPVFQWHYYGADLPQGAVRLAGSDLYPNQILRFGSARYGVQCHAEMSLTGQRYLLDRDTGWAGRRGVQQRDEQERRAIAHYAAMRAWFAGFLQRWLDECRTATNAIPPRSIDRC